MISIFTAKRGSVIMERCCKYLYQIELVTNGDVVEFNKVATKFPGKVYLVNCYFDFRKFIVE